MVKSVSFYRHAYKIFCNFFIILPLTLWLRKPIFMTFSVFSRPSIINGSPCESPINITFDLPYYNHHMHNNVRLSVIIHSVSSYSGVDVMGQEIHNFLQLLCNVTDGWAKNVTYNFFSVGWG